MKRHTKLCALCLLGLSVLQAQAQDSDMLTQSRAVTQAMLKELGQKLQSSMAEDGPINAIGVCHLQAPDIANRASTNNQAKISRVGTRARNPVMGVPNDWGKPRLWRSLMQLWPVAKSLLTSSFLKPSTRHLAKNFTLPNRLCCSPCACHATAALIRSAPRSRPNSMSFTPTIKRWVTSLANCVARWC